MMEDKIKSKVDELKNQIDRFLSQCKTKEYRDEKIKLFIEKVEQIIHEITVDPLKRRYYFYQFFSLFACYGLYCFLSLGTLLPHCGLTARIFFPHYRTIHWLMISIILSFILYKVIRYYYYEIVMRDKLTANGEKGSAEWANERLDELKYDDMKLLDLEGVVTAPIEFSTLEELDEEEKSLEEEIERLRKLL